MTLEDVDDALAAKVETTIGNIRTDKPGKIDGETVARLLLDAMRVAKAYREALKEIDACHLRDVRDEQLIAELRGQVAMLRQQMRDDEKAAADGATKLVKENSRLRMQVMDLQQEAAELRSFAASGAP